MPNDLINVLYSHNKDIELYKFLNETGELSEILTVDDLRKKIEDLAFRLKGYHAGTRALLIFPTCSEFVVSFFACLYIGIIPVPISVPGRRQGIEIAEAIQHDCNAQLILSTTKTYELLERSIDKSSLSSLDLFLINKNDFKGRFINRRENDRGIAFLQYTSGSTSTPKGVVVTHENILSNQHMIQERFRTTKDTVFLGWTPLHHDMGLIGNVMQPMYAGCQCYLVTPTMLLMRPKVWLSVLSKYKITTTGGPNFSYKQILKRISKEKLKSLSIDLSNLSVLYNGAEPIEPDIIKHFTDRFVPYGFHEETFLPCYGLAEATLLATGIYPKDKFKTTLKQTNKISSTEGELFSSIEYVSCGPPVVGVKISIRELTSDLEIENGNVGKIYISGANVSPGYWKDICNTTHFEVDRWLNTGDIGFQDKANHLYICGRSKELLIIDGKNHYPQDIENTINSSLTGNDITESVAFSHQNHVYSIIELSKLCHRNISSNNLDELRSKILSAVSNMHGITIDNIIFVKPNSIPKTTSFKVQRQKLKLDYINNKVEEV
jgi:acyl-CoA synthetase (AMP-forming)/AMP-acid ligase II